MNNNYFNDVTIFPARQVGKDIQIYEKPID